MCALDVDDLVEIYGPMTQATVAWYLGISREGVAYHERKALKKMRKRVERGMA